MYTRIAMALGHPATTMATLYDGRNLPPNTTGSASNFSTPTVFKGQVYIGTHAGIDVFGLCTSCPH